MRLFTKILFVLTCITSSSAFAASLVNHLHTPKVSKENAPWFTGPLLAPGSDTVPPGHFNVQPFTFFSANTGSYDEKGKVQTATNSYAVIERIILQAGITDFMDAQLFPTFSHRFTRGAQSTQVDDMTFLVDLQLWRASAGTKMPNVKIALNASAPIGKYHKLNPNNYGTDASGSGSWQPSGMFFLGRLYQLPNSKFLSVRAAMNYTAQTPVKVRGLNTYGGAPDTRGTVYPGNVFWADIGMEYTLTRNWVVAIDAFYEYINKTRFSGNPGSSGTMRSLAGESFSLAPAIEYNFSINVGLIAGVWFTYKGKNTPRFIDGIISINIYI